MNEINDRLNDKEDKSFLLKIREEGGLEKEDLIGKGKVTSSDGISSYWIVGGISQSSDEDDSDSVHDYSKDYLTFTTLVDSYFTFTASPLQYSLDSGVTWVDTVPFYNTELIPAGSKVLWRGELTPNLYGVGTFSSRELGFTVEGNPMSLIYGDNFRGKTDLTVIHSSLEDGLYVFRGLFKENLGLISAENLVLPATLSPYCYYEMFKTCKALTTAPTLSATSLVDNCYKDMFLNCNKLNYIKCLATDISATDCTDGWVNGVSPEGTFVKAVSMNDWTTGTSGIPSGWAVEDA